MEYYKRVLDGLIRVATTIYSLEEQQEPPDDVHQMLIVLGHLAEQEAAKYLAVTTLFELRNSLAHQVPGAELVKFPGWSDLLSASDILINWLRELSMRSLSTDTDFQSYVFWAKFISQICQLNLALVTEKDPRTEYKEESQSFSVEEAPEEKLDLEKEAKQKSAAAATLPSAPILQEVAEQKKKESRYPSGTIKELRAETGKKQLTKNSYIIILDGKFEGMYGYYRKSNGTTVFIDVDGIGRKAISVKRRIGIVRRG